MPRRVPENARLLFGPYTPPPLKRGDRATGLYRDSDVVITSWSDALISWPRCKVRGQRGGSGLLVDEELARAVRSEAEIAVAYWWGIRPETVRRWRKALGVEGPAGTEGSRRLLQANAEKGAAVVRGKPLPPEQVELRRRNAIQNNQAQYLRGTQKGGWTAGQLAVLGRYPDDRVAVITGRTENAVRIKRERLGIPNPRSPGWTEEELKLLGTAPDAEIARQIGRTEWPVTQKRCSLGIPTFRDKRKACGPLP